jgi:transglutaminase-like putative cysteine protease/uncharacterized membrane protein YgcG
MGSTIAAKMRAKLKKSLSGRNLSAWSVQMALATAVAFSVIRAIAETSGLEASAGMTLIACFAMLLGFTVLFYSGIIANVALLGAIATLSAYLFRLHSADRLGEMRIRLLYFFQRYLNWMASFFMIRSPRNARYELWLFLAICFAVCLFAYIFIIKKYTFSLLFAAGFATFTIQWAYGFFAGNLSFAVFLCALVIGYIWHIYLRNRHAFDASALLAPFRFLLHAVPMCAALAAVIALLPIPDSPIRWQWIYDRYNDVAMGFNDRFYYFRVDNFAINTTGFSDGESFLSGPVRLNNMQVLTVRTDNPRLYLKGNGKDIYTGNSWKSGYLEYMAANADGKSAEPDTGEDSAEPGAGGESAYGGSGAETAEGGDSSGGSGSGSGSAGGSGSGSDAETAADGGRSAAGASGDGETSDPDIEEMASAIGGRNRITGELYSSGNSEADADVGEYVANNALFLYRAMEESADVVNRMIFMPNFIQDSAERILGDSKKNASISFDRMKTRSMFTPAKMSGVSDINMDVGDIYEENGSLSAERVMAEGFGYNVEYYEDGEAPLTSHMLSSSYAGLYGDLLERYDTSGIQTFVFNVGSDFQPQGEIQYQYQSQNQSQNQSLPQYQGRRSSQTAFRISYLRLSDVIGRDRLAELADRAAEIRDRYLGLPPGLPERVSSLSLALTEGKATDFERASELEKFLYTNYEYSLDVSYLPPGEDFVDNFLFSMNKGYCTHFASAMAIMARCAGLPSRYVEGYVLPAEKSPDNAYYLTNAEAHAWVEIYFEGYGWKAFEPTASFQRDSGAGSDAADATQADDSASYYDHLIDEYDMYANDERYDSAVDSARPPDADAGTAGRGGAPAKKWIAFAALAIAALGAALVAAGKLRKRARAESFSAEPNEAIGSMFSHYYGILRRLECSLAGNETPSQYAARAEERFHFRGNSFMRATEIFVRLCYSSHGASESDRRQVYDLYPQILELYASRRNKLAFRLMKDVLSII